ncbi:hypothetical protein BGW41_007081 [Actinomortierella wolfii]|nr:hypothetical protein BGW41_007081 [Actinomortierella wolfii]
MVALMTIHGTRSRNTSRMQAMASKVLSQRACQPVQLEPHILTRPHLLQGVFYSNSAIRPSEVSVRGRTRTGKGGGGRGSNAGEGEPPRTNKSTHPLFHDLQQQQHRQQQRQASSPSVKAINRPDIRINKLPKSIMATTSTLDATKENVRQHDVPHAHDQAAFTGDNINNSFQPSEVKKKERSHGGGQMSHEYPPTTRRSLEHTPAPPGSVASSGSTTSFSACRTPTQLRKAIHHFLASHPQPNSQHVVEMLKSCIDLAQMASSTAALPMHGTNRHRGGKVRWDSIADTTASKVKETSKESSNNLDTLSDALLDSIYQSLDFSQEEVFDLATWIYQYGWEQERQAISVERPSTSLCGLVVMRPTPSVEVLNYYLRVCGITHHVDRAIEMFDDRSRILKDVKPDVSVYAHWLWALARESSLHSSSGTALSPAADSKAQEVIDVASKSLARQAGFPYWIKMLLGAMIGGTVGKFTTLGWMALSGGGSETAAPATATSTATTVSAPETESLEAAMTAASHVGSSLSADGVLHALASTDIATTAGLGAFALSFGLFLFRDTATIVAKSATAFSEMRNSHGHSDDMNDIHHQGSSQAQTNPSEGSTELDVDIKEQEEEKDSDDATEQILEKLQQVQHLPRARFLGPYYFQDLVSKDEGVLRRYLEEQYQQLKKSEERNRTLY